MELSQVAIVAQIGAALAVFCGVGFALVQLRQFKRQRDDAAAYSFVSQWDGEFLERLGMIYALPDGADASRIENDPELRKAANGVYVLFEHLGIMVHQRSIDLNMANEWAGGAVRVGWRKLRPWIESKRDLAKSQRPGEWFQWLAERVDEHPARDENEGAFVTHGSWRP